MPPVPLFELRHIFVKVSTGAMTVSDVTFYEGFGFDVDMTIFGVDIKAGFHVSPKDIGAYFSSTRISWLAPILELCKNSVCRSEEGPHFEFHVQWAKMPPTLLIKLDCYISFLGLNLGVHIFVQYKDWTNFRAEFYVNPIHLAGGALQLKKSDLGTGNADEMVKCGKKCGEEELLQMHTPSEVKAEEEPVAMVQTQGGPAVDPTTGLQTAADFQYTPDTLPTLEGPYAIFDTKNLYIYISAKIRLFVFEKQIQVAISKTEFYIGLQSKHFGFPFTTEVKAGFAASGLPNSFNLKMEAGDSTVPGGLAAKMRADAWAKLDAAKEAGAKPIRAAQAKLESAKKAFDDATAKVRKHKADVEREKQKIDKLCEEEEDESKLLEDSIATGRSRKLLSATDDLSDIAEAPAELVQTDSKQAAFSKIALNAKGWHRHHWHHPHRHHWHHRHHRHHWHHRHHRHHWHHRHWPHIHIPHRWHAHIGNALKALANGVANAAKEIGHAVAKFGCAAVKATAKAGLTVYQGLVDAAIGVVNAAKTTLDVAKAFLEGVLALHSAAFWLMKKMVSAIFIVDYVKLEAFIKPNLLDSGISGSLSFDFGGTKFTLSATITLGNLASIVTSIFNKIWDLIKKLGKALFEEEVTQSALQQMDMSKLFEKGEFPHPNTVEVVTEEELKEFDANFQLVDPKQQARVDLLQVQLEAAEKAHAEAVAKYDAKLQELIYFENHFLEEVAKRAKQSRKV